MATGFPTVDPMGSSLDDLVRGLKAGRLDWQCRAAAPAPAPRCEQLPLSAAVHDTVHDLIRALFPLHMGPGDLQRGEEDVFVAGTLSKALVKLSEQVLRELRYHRRSEGVAAPEEALRARAEDIVSALCGLLPAISRTLGTDIVAAYKGDPSAISVDEALLCYPGVQAIIHHRLAHALHGLGLPLMARIISERSHTMTGIDIHPGAVIGQSFFIDHGTGVVIGESAVIGNRVRLYHAVTLGAKRFPTDEHGQLTKGEARHPIVEDDVVVYAGATILGRVTVGKGAIIGGNVWLTQDVAPGCTVTQANVNRPEVADRP